MEEHKHSILIVEDDNDVQYMLQTLIELQDFRVMTASNGVEALDILTSVQPLLIIMDISMPIVDGITTAHLIRKHEHLRAIPIIFITAHGTLGIKLYQDHLHALEGGPIEYLPKPIDTQLLEDLINRLTLTETPSKSPPQ